MIGEIGSLSQSLSSDWGISLGDLNSAMISHLSRIGSRPSFLFVQVSMDTHIYICCIFLQTTTGECGHACEFRLSCGHVCARRCHDDDREHDAYQCMKQCEKTCKYGHKCSKKCCESCQCIKKVRKVMILVAFRNFKTWNQQDPHLPIIKT